MVSIGARKKNSSLGFCTKRVVVIVSALALLALGLQASSLIRSLEHDLLQHSFEKPMNATLSGAAVLTETNQIGTNDRIVGTGSDAMSEDQKENWKQKMDAWVYEPKNVNYFWKKMGDRPFQREFYSRLGKGNFNRILDVGARSYNKFCKDLINSTSVEYLQMEPNLPSDPSDLKNDGLFECYMNEVREKYPDQGSSFDLVIDFGVFGWKLVQNEFDDTKVKGYVNSVTWLLRDKGCWVLKTDQGWVPNEVEFFDKHILPYFTMKDFDNHAYESGHSIKGGNFKFYFFYKK
mmetsp:Transcript_25947/g.54663  ORF Transcript_25947/g.54663 Transcript_25947/m.54663 type:complete len:291 (-) Transcript_25947:213-1085(-)